MSVRSKMTFAWVEDFSVEVSVSIPQRDTMSTIANVARRALVK